jgi:hypothetical protein
MKDPKPDQIDQQIQKMLEIDDIVDKALEDNNIKDRILIGGALMRYAVMCFKFHRAPDQEIRNVFEGLMDTDWRRNKDKLN